MDDPGSMSAHPRSEPDWIRLYRETLRPLYAYVSRRAGSDRELAEDVTHEAWLRALEAWRGAGFPRDPLAWLKAVARNLLSNYYRRRRPEGIDAGEAAAEIGLEREELAPETPRAAALLHWGLARLRAPQARLLESFHFDGKGVAALAAELGLSERAVEGRLRRSRLALRDRLAPYFHPPDA